MPEFLRPMTLASGTKWSRSERAGEPVSSHSLNGPVQFFSAFNYELHPFMLLHYCPDQFCILKAFSGGLLHFPFPDMAQFNPRIADEIRGYVESPLCRYCRAVLL
jgi:hypothetical protein